MMSYDQGARHSTLAFGEKALMQGAAILPVAQLTLVSLSWILHTGIAWSETTITERVHARTHRHTHTHLQYHRS